jgi:hypothetical protein
MVLAHRPPRRKEHISMSRRTTMKHSLVAALAGVALTASTAVAKPIDRIDRYDNAAPRPYQDLRGEHATDPAPPGSERFQPGQPTWPTHPVPVPKPDVAPVSQVAPSDDGNDDVWLIVGIGMAAAGIVAGSAAGMTRRYRVRARRVAA